MKRSPKRAPKRRPTRRPARRPTRRPARPRSRRPTRRAIGRPTRRAPDARLAARAAAAEIDAIRARIETAAAARPPRWNADPEDVRRSVLKLVLTLVELIRQLLERQAIRRMEAGTLTPDQTESVGLALMRLQETIAGLAAQFEISPDALNLDLGPVGRLL